MSFVTLFSHPHAALLQFNDSALEVTGNHKGEAGDLPYQQELADS